MTDHLDPSRQAQIMTSAARTAADLYNFIQGELPEHPNAMDAGDAQDILDQARGLRVALDAAANAYRRVAEDEASQAQPQQAAPWQQQYAQPGHYGSLPQASAPRPAAMSPQPQQAPTQQPQQPYYSAVQQ